MKRYDYIFTFFLTAVFLFSSCSEEPFSSDNGVNLPSDGLLRLSIGVDDYVDENGAESRAEDSGAEFSFESGDRVGILVFSNGDSAPQNNLPYIFDGERWIFDTATAESENSGKVAWFDAGEATLTVYYPYDAAADRVFDQTGLKRLFVPLADQQTAEAYRKSDLMACSATVRNLVLEARLSHVYASFSLQPSVAYTLTDGKGTRIEGELARVNLTVGDRSAIVPYRAEDGSYRYILPADFTSGEVRWFYSCGTATYGGTRYLDEAAPNVRYSQIDRVDCGEYGYGRAKVGDYFCTTQDGTVGYLLPSEAARLIDEHECVGVVFQTDLTRIGEAEKDALGGVAHALAISVKNAPCAGGYGDQAWWGRYGYPEEQIRDCTTKVDNYTDLSGYHNTQAILVDRAEDIDQLGLYQAFRAVRDYRHSTPLPENTSDWFLPSAGQWWDVLQIMGKAPALAEAAEQQSTEHNGTEWIEQGDVIGMLNGWIAGIAVEKRDDFAAVADRYGISSGGYWTSSEYSLIYAVKWIYQADVGQLVMTRNSKHYNANVRCAFAF